MKLLMIKNFIFNMYRKPFMIKLMKLLVIKNFIINMYETAYEKIDENHL